MANARYREFDTVKDSGSPPPASKAGSKHSVNEKTASWPGIPGKAQPRDRSAGVPKIRQSVKMEGL